MSNSPVYLTQEGYNKLREELDHLVNVRRREIAEQIAEAKAEGDLRENAGYDEAKNAQAFVEGRIRELEVKIRNAYIIDDSDSPSDKVALGRRVVVQEVGTSDEERYVIVGSTEADPRNGRISNESPIGKALMGKRKGATVTAATPGGEIDFKILRIE
ncbi:MAG: transcription elongation factor GreA [Caldilineaceae bacterium]|nr:transcription elongation factor GreA [Caldilineaceae bacterium]HRJ42928.1 transcription elongation factor GreA [Caldilineaceae bacterium]